MHYAFSGGPGSGDHLAVSALRPAALAGANPGDLLLYRYKPEQTPAHAPLLVVLHGCGQTAIGLDQGAGWSALARRFGFALLAPQQVAANNIATCFNWFQPGDTRRGQGEAASIRQMIAETIKEFSSDPARIFITGLSAGGGMTSAMLAAYPEVFSAGAIIAGLPHGAAANLQEAIGAMRAAPARSPREWGDAVRQASRHSNAFPRVAVWHGDADRTVAISNRDAILAQWRDVHGLTTEPKRTQRQNAVHLCWRDGQGQTVLESYEVPGLGHGIPIKTGAAEDCCGQPAPFILEAGISSSFHIADFFGLTSGIKAPAVIASGKKPSSAAPALKPARPSSSAAPPSPQPVPRSPLKTPPGEPPGSIRRVIVRALKAAGLIREKQ